MRRALLAVPVAVLLLAGCAPGALDPDPEAVPGSSASPSASPSLEPTTSAEPAPSDPALPPMTTTCADLDSPEAAAVAIATDYAPQAREWDAQGVDGLPAPLLTCLWGPDGGSDSLITVGVYEVDEATVAALVQRDPWEVSQVAGTDVHALVVDDGYHVELVWAERDGRLLYVIGSQADAARPIAAAVVPTVLGG